LNRLDRFQALMLRADAYRELGQDDLEQADRAEIHAITRDWMQGRGVNPYQPPWFLSPFTWVSGLLIVGGGFVVMVPVFFLIGRRQRREAGGTWRRLIWISLALAALQMVPVLAAFLVGRRLGLLNHGELVFITFVVFAVNISRHAAYLAPVRWMHSREAPPLLEDPVVLGCVAQIAGRMALAPPVTRLARSPSALQQNNAQIGGLVAPTMVLFDGVLHRLTEEERDSIIAHELAHLANHTFWYRLLGGAVCSVVVVAASVFYPSMVVLALGLALLTGSWLILSRWLELDCDRRAARAIGHRRTAAALWKIHSDHPFRGVFEFLFNAVSTHPSRDERLAAVYRDAPNDDRPEVEWNPRLLRYRRLAAWCAAGLWLAIVAACLLWGYRSPGSKWPALPLVLMEVALVVLVWLGLRKTLRRKRRLQRTRTVWLRWLLWLVPALLGLLFLAQEFGLTRPYLNSSVSAPLLAGGFWVCLLLALVLGRSRATKLNHKIVIAIQSGDYPRALALCESKPAVVAKSTILRYNYALIRAVLGRREEALTDLERLRRDEPSFKMTWLLLINLYADEGEYARALELASQLSHDLPDEPNGPLFESWLLRKLGRPDEAEARAREALKMDAHLGQAHLTLAAVAFDRGDRFRAREELAQAERLVPGTVWAALVVAEMALATDEGAEAAVQQAVKAARNNPLAFAEKEVERLSQQLEARRLAVSPERSVP
jgi:Zn-dependent protease with chaperone function